MLNPVTAVSSGCNPVTIVNAFNSVTVGIGGQFSTITDAVTENTGTTIVERNEVDKSVSVSGATITGTGTNWEKDVAIGGGNGDEGMFLGDLIKLGDSRWYKIKHVNSDTEAVLYEDGPAGAASFTLARITRKTILLYPGEYAETIPLEPGFDIVGVDRNACILSENASSPSYPLGSWGENYIANLTIGPTEAWGALDSMAGQNPFSDYWAGGDLQFSNVRIQQGNYDRTHAGGAGNWPMMPNGRTIYDNMDISVGGTFRDTINADTRTAAETQVIFRNSVFEKIPDWNYSAGTIEPCLLVIPREATVSIQSVKMRWAAGSGGASFGGLVGIRLGTTILNSQATNSILNVDGLTLECDETSFTAIEAKTATATVNIANSRITSVGTTAKGVSAQGADVNIVNSDVTGVTSGVECTNAGSTVSLRSGTRVKGTTNSLVQSAGTLNKGSFCTSIGAETGTITAADT